MSFSLEAGYQPRTISELMNVVRINVNEQFGTEYEVDTFLGTNFYKFFYSVIQELQANEVRASEIVLRLQQYFDVTNEMIVRPNTTHPGIFDYFSARGFIVSSKPPADADAGKVYIAIDLDSGADDYDDKKLEACTIIKDCVAAGIVSQGSEVETLTLSNNQSFDYKFNLPDVTTLLLRLTLVNSANNQFSVLSPEETAQLLFDNINARYRLGLSFEPQRYFSVLDAPWAASVLLEYKLDGAGSWLSAVYVSDYDELFTFGLEDIEVVES